jgi:hypothetical protein
MCPLDGVGTCTVPFTPSRSSLEDVATVSGASIERVYCVAEDGASVPNTWSQTVAKVTPRGDEDTSLLSTGNDKTF